MLLQLVDFRAISSENPSSASLVALSMGPCGDELERSVNEALEFHRAGTPNDFQAMRRCLQHWLTELGASCEPSGRIVMPNVCDSLCWHEGALSGADWNGSVWRWEPSDEDDLHPPVVVAGNGGPVADPRYPSNQILLAEVDKHRQVSFQNEHGQVLLSPDDDAGLYNVFCSHNGSFCLLTREVLYVGDDVRDARILCLRPGEAKPVVVGEVPPTQGWPDHDLLPKANFWPTMIQVTARGPPSWPPARRSPVQSWSGINL